MVVQFEVKLKISTDTDMVLFALNANFLNRALVLSAFVIVSQAWSTIKKSIDFLMKGPNMKK